MLKEFRQERIDFARFHKSAEKECRSMFRKALRNSYQPVIDAVAGGMDMRNIPVALIIRTDVWRSVYPALYERIGMRMARKEFYRQRTLEGIESKASAIDLLINVWSSLLRDYALTYTYQIERYLNDRTIELITKALGDSYELGVDRLGRTRLFNKWIRENLQKRGDTITRTEVTSMANLGKRIGADSWIKQQGGQGYKLWLGRQDPRERKTHLEENDTILMIEELHVVGGEQCEAPGDVRLTPKERANCRCTESYMSENRYNGLVKRGRIVNGRVIGAS